VDQELERVPLQPLAQRQLPAPRQRHGPGQRRGVEHRHHVRPRRAPRGHRIVPGGRSQVSDAVFPDAVFVVAPGRVLLNRPQVTDHVTGDIDGAPARARRWRLPAARRHPGQHHLKAVQRANETVQGHVSQYRLR
jgi:hypothetical protein